MNNFDSSITYMIEDNDKSVCFESFQYVYKKTDGCSTILVEWRDYYGEK